MDLGCLALNEAIDLSRISSLEEACANTELAVHKFYSEVDLMYNC